MTHQFDIEVAREYGIADAVVINHFQFWIAKNKANGSHQHEGRTWTYNSMKAFGELFPYLTEKQLRTIIRNLVDRGVLTTGNFNETTYDRTLWYAFVEEEKWLCQKGQMHLTEKANGIAQKGKPIPYNIPDNNTSTITPSINNFDNIINKEAEFEKSSAAVIDRLCEWLANDFHIRGLQFVRLGIMSNDTPFDEFINILREYATKFYFQCRLDGKGDIISRGASEVISHFNNWIVKYVNGKKRKEVNDGANAIDETMQSIMAELEE